MRYLLVILMLIPTVAMADVYVITTPTHSVYSLSEANDAVLPQGYTKDIIKGRSIASFALNPMTSLYDYTNGSFTLNQDRVAEKNASDQAAVQAKADEVAAKASAMAKLKALGLTDQEIGSLVR